MRRWMGSLPRYPARDVPGSAARAAAGSLLVDATVSGMNWEFFFLGSGWQIARPTGRWKIGLLRCLTTRPAIEWRTSGRAEAPRQHQIKRGLLSRGPA